MNTEAVGFNCGELRERVTSVTTWSSHVSKPVATLIARVLGGLEDPRRRYRVYAIVAVAFYALAWAAAGGRALIRDVPVDFLYISDSRGYYAYLPSLVIDGDLNFLNQAYDQYGGPDNVPKEILEQRDSRGYLRNRWPMGTALTMAPAFLCAHGMSLLLFKLTGSTTFLPNGYTILYPLISVAYIMAFGALGMAIADRLLVRRFRVGGPAAAAGVLCLWVGSFYAWYYFREPFMSHVASAAWVTLTVYLVDRILRDLDAGRLTAHLLLLLAFTMSMALICRVTNAFLAPFFVYLLWRIVRGGFLLQTLKLTPLLLLALTPVLLQAVVWLSLNRASVGQTGLAVQSVGYDREEGFHWGSPALLQTLFSSRHGLFFWSPILLWSAWGLVWHMTRRGGWRDPLLVCFLISATLLWYVNSAWWAWWWGWSFGARGFLELAVLFVIGFAFAAEHLATLTARARNAVVASLAVAVVFNYGLMFLYFARLISRGQALLWW